MKDQNPKEKLREFYKEILQQMVRKGSGDLQALCVELLQGSGDGE